MTIVLPGSTKTLIDRAVAVGDFPDERQRQVDYIAHTLTSLTREPADVRLLESRLREIVREHERCVG